MSMAFPSVDNDKSFFSSVYPLRQHIGAMVPAEQSISETLPELYSGANIDSTKPKSHPTSLQSDFLPEEIIISLTQPQPCKQKLKHSSRRGNFNIGPVETACHPPPASVWNYKRRNRFKHLLDYAPCVCGAGRDISFLYDVPRYEPHPPKPDALDQSNVRKEDKTTIAKPRVLSDSIIPEEYHIVKNKGVLGIQFQEDKYSTQSLDHEKHMALFPSMKPTSRYEVIHLRNTFESMMDKAGINNLEIDAAGGLTQIHKLLQLIKKEQDIFNIVFSELIRQTTVGCAERGELLHLVWNKYNQLLNQVPEQIMSLHEDVIAQRALDIRLTDELMRFKSTIGTLTNELADVKEHDRKVTMEAQKAQENLRSALAESHKNASLIVEYHDLYELQRQRLERQVFTLSEERDIWSTAAYSLAIKVTEEHKLNTAMRLHLIEKSWVKKASHFTTLLSDRDTDLLTKIQEHLEKWRNLIEDMNISLKQREKNMRDSIQFINDGVEIYLTIFKQKYIGHNNEVVKIPEKDFTSLLLSSVKSWLESVVKETDDFNGVLLLNSREKFSQLRKEMDEWTDCALKMFERHCSGESKMHPYHISMLALNKEINQFLIQFHDRITGESGIANLLIHFQSSLETWETHVSSSALGALVFQESEWSSFYHVLEDWLSLLNQATDFGDIGLNIADKHDGQSQPSVQDMIRKAQTWVTKASISIDCEDGKLVEQVSTLHFEMVKWTIQVLLRLSPNIEGYSQEAGDIALLGSASIQQLTEMSNTLFESLKTFSNYVAFCCDGIVMEETLRRQSDHEENANYEVNDLKRLKSECTDWIQTAQMLMSHLTGISVEIFLPTQTSAILLENQEISKEEDIHNFVETEIIQNTENENTDIDLPQVLSHRNSGEVNKETRVLEVLASEDVHEVSIEAILRTEADSTNKEHPVLLKALDVNLDNSSSTSDSKTEEVKIIEVLGLDENTHRKSIEGKNIQSMVKHPSKYATEGTSDTKKAYEALAVVKALQEQLIATEERAQLAEERATQAEAELASLEEKIRSLEKQLEKTHTQVELRSTSPSTTAFPKSQPTVNTSIKLPRTHSPIAGSDMKEEKSGKKYGKSSSKSSKRS